MKEKTKKGLIIAGLLLVCAGLIFGISRMVYKEPEQVLAENQTIPDKSEPVVERKSTGEEKQEPEKVETTVTAEQTEAEKKANDENTGRSENAEKETEEPDELVIETEAVTGSSTNEQELQPEPEKTENEKPQEAPELVENTDTTDHGNQPVYEEEPDRETGSMTPPAGNTPDYGDVKDNMIYIPGFGWIPYEGGGGSGAYAGDMYENGNKVGNMD